MAESKPHEIGRLPSPSLGGMAGQVHLSNNVKGANYCIRLSSQLPQGRPIALASSSWISRPCGDWVNNPIENPGLTVAAARSSWAIF